MLYFVGTGPGDKELITLKALRLIKEAEAIVYPDTGMGKSSVLNIISDYTEGKPLYPVSIPMKGGRESWLMAHKAAAERILELSGQYKNLVYPVLGDPGIYASCSYLISLLDIDCEIIPGISSFCLGAAELKIPLCEQGEKLIIQDSISGKLPEDNCVIMKSGRKLSEIKAAAKGREAYALRNLGMDKQWLGRLSDIPEDEYSYFTSVIIKKDKSEDR